MSLTNHLSLLPTATTEIFELEAIAGTLTAECQDWKN